MQCNILWSKLNAVQYIAERAWLNVVLIYCGASLVKCSAIYCRASLVKCSVNILWSEPGSLYCGVSLVHSIVE